MITLEVFGALAAMCLFLGGIGWAAIRLTVDRDTAAGAGLTVHAIEGYDPPQFLPPPLDTPAPAVIPIPAAGAGAITGVVVYHPEPGPLQLLADGGAAVKALPLDDYLNQVALHTGYRDRPPLTALLSDDTLARGEIPAITDEVA